MSGRVIDAAGAEVASAAQRMLMEAGYEPKSDWLFIDDLVLKYRTQHAGREGLLDEVESFLTTSPRPVTRAAFVHFNSEVQRRERVRQQRSRLAEIYARADVAETDSGHEALAIRIVELERAVQAYSQKLKAAEQAASQSKTDGIFPFLAGVVIGGIAF